MTVVIPATVWGSRPGRRHPRRIEREFIRRPRGAKKPFDGRPAHHRRRLLGFFPRCSGKLIVKGQGRRRKPHQGGLGAERGPGRFGGKPWGLDRSSGPAGGVEQAQPGPRPDPKRPFSGGRRGALVDGMDGPYKRDGGWLRGLRPRGGPRGFAGGGIGTGRGGKPTGRARLAMNCLRHPFMRAEKPVAGGGKLGEESQAPRGQRGWLWG